MSTRSLNGCVVLTGPLTSAVRAFIERWDAERPPSRGNEFVSGIQWLISETGLSEDVIWSVRRGRYSTTAMSTADAIVEALGHPEWFYDGTLTVRPNPKGPAALRAECCGGSSTSP